MLNLDLTKLMPLLERGERVVVVIPDTEPLVLLPLKEYDELAKNHKIKNSQTAEVNKEPVWEDISPLAGGLADDDQYYPEPL